MPGVGRSARMPAMSVRFTILGSGSGGNCAYLEAGETRLLIDAGFSARQIRERLAAIGRGPETLSGVIITHEHGDHIQGLGFFAPLYTPGLGWTAVALAGIISAIFLRERWLARRTHAAPEAPLLERLDAEIRFLRRQRRLLETFHWWFLLPILVATGLFVWAMVEIGRAHVLNSSH